MPADATDQENVEALIVIAERYRVEDDALRECHEKRASTEAA
jgi:hypothetical protein